MFSIYTNLAPGKSHVKFGGYDESGMKNKGEMVVLKTVNHTTWSIKLDSVQLNDMKFKLRTFIDQVASFNPAYPYIYLPEEDFKLISAQLNKVLGTFQNKICNPFYGECRILKSC